jgi:hypothetical protein
LEGDCVRIGAEIGASVFIKRSRKRP